MKKMRITTIKTSALHPLKRLTMMMSIFTVPQWALWFLARALGAPTFPNGYPIWLPIAGSSAVVICAGFWLFAYLYLRRHHPNMVKPEVTTKEVFMVDGDESNVH